MGKVAMNSLDRAEHGDGCEAEGGDDPGSGVVETVGMDEAVSAPAADGVGEEERDEEAPGEEPDEVEGPVEVARQLVVVHRDAAAEEAEDVLVVMK